MDTLKTLEVDRLIKKLEFVISDYEYQSELMSGVERHFQTSVSELLKEYPQLSEFYEENKFDDGSESIDIEQNSDQSVIKDLYKKIVKETHPDKTADSKMNTLFKEASQAYKNKDIVDMIRYGHALNIDIEDIPIDKIKERIEMIEKKTEFLKKTYTWKWMVTDDQIEKRKIIIQYLRSNII